jgi:hypothetical protein
LQWQHQWLNAPIGVGAPRRLTAKPKPKAQRPELVRKNAPNGPQSVAPSSSAPASDVIAQPSNDVTTARPSARANPNRSRLHPSASGTPCEGGQVVMLKRLSQILRPEAPIRCERSGRSAKFVLVATSSVEYFPLLLNVCGHRHGIAIQQPGHYVGIADQIIFVAPSGHRLEGVDFIP